MMQEYAEKRSEFRFPVVIPVEYFKPDDSRISSYSLDISKGGTFISADDPLDIGSRCGMQLAISFGNGSSEIFKTEGIVAWNMIQPFQSKKNGMGIQFSEPFPERLLFHALADATHKLTMEAEGKSLLQEKVEKLESELEETKRFAVIGRYVEKILIQIANPILTLSGKLEIIRLKMHKSKALLKNQGKTNKEEIKKIVKELDNHCREIDQILKDYKIISKLAQIAGDDRETLERKLKKWKLLN